MQKINILDVLLKKFFPPSSRESGCHSLIVRLLEGGRGEGVEWANGGVEGRKGVENLLVGRRQLDESACPWDGSDVAGSDGNSYWKFRWVREVERKGEKRATIRVDPALRPIHPLPPPLTTLEPYLADNSSFACSKLYERAAA